MFKVNKKYEKKTRSENPSKIAKDLWAIVYSGFVLILLCFFIMLSSFATMEETKVLRFVKSFVHAVNIHTGGLKLDSGKEILPDPFAIIEKNSKISRLLKELQESVKNFKLEKEIYIIMTEKGIVTRLSDTFLFDAGVAEIARKAKPLLNRLGNIISSTTCNLRIEGHTDNQAIHTEKFPSNWELSTARAVNVLRYFIEKNNIPIRRLSAEGFGEFRPIFSNDTPVNRAKNRRVEIVFVNDDPDNSKEVINEKKIYQEE